MNHPFRNTCSGWAEGYEAGQADGIAKIRDLEEDFKEAVLSVVGNFMFKDQETGEVFYDSMCMSDGEHYLPLAIKYGWIDKKLVKRI